MSIDYWKHRDTHRTPDMVTFAATSDKNPSAGAVVSMVQGKEEPNFVVNRRGNLEHNPYVSKESSEGQLFHHTPPKIILAQTSKSMRFTAPTLLGMAYNESKKTGRLMVGSSLSKHSARLAKKAADMDLVQVSAANEGLDVSNSMDFRDIGPELHRVVTDRYTEMPTREEVKAGRDTARSVLDGRRKHLSEGQFSPSYQQLGLDI